MKFLTYTNGVGHLIMSIATLLVGLFLITWPNLDTVVRGVGIGLLTTVTSAWFIPGAAKQVATNVQEQVQQNNNDGSAK